MRIIFECFLLYTFIISSENMYTNNKLNEIAEEIIKISFPSRNKCLYYSSDYSITDGIETVLMKMNVQIFSIPLENIRDISVFSLKCKGYIISTDNITTLQQLIVSTKTNNLYNFQPHKRMLVFFEGNFIPNNFPFAYTKTYLAINVFIVWKKQPQKKLFHIFQHEEKVFVATSENKSILINQNDTLNVKANIYESIKWRFTLKNNNYKKKWKVAFFHVFPLVLYNKKEGLYGGLEYKIIKELLKGWPIDFIYNEKSTNFRAYEKLANDTILGKTDTNMCGQWQKIILDLGGEPTFPHTQTCVTFLVPKPKILEDITVLFNEFSHVIWFVCILISLFYLYIYKRTEKRTVIGASLISIYSFAYILFTTAYSSCLTTYLRYPRHTNFIRNFDDVIKQKLQWVHSNNFYQTFFYSVGTENSRKVAESFHEAPTITMKNELLRTDKYAAIVKFLPYGIPADIDTYDEYGKTHLRRLPQCFMVHNIAFALTKNSPYKKVFDEQIVKFIEHGLVRFWYRNIIYTKKYSFIHNFHTLYESDYKPKPLRLQQILSAFVLIFGGLFAAVLVFLVEVFYHRFK